MKNIVVPQLRVGVFGWNSGFQESNLYPDDLPDEWRLTYISNMVDVVVVPFDELMDADQDTVEGWEDDTHENIGFYISLHHSQLLSDPGFLENQVLKKIALLHDRLVGILLYEDCEIPHDLFSNIPLFQMADIATNDSLMESVISLRGGDGVALLHASQELIPMEMRTLVELLKKENLDTLIFIPGPGLSGNIENAETISSLLG
ncbi:MAG: hypothetical protein H8D24_03120 [Gammaproteobacteria bacterium]|uniref:Uncharacterized protein n=1 Tax=Candidatus Thiopontia autotrophica TaxID=2841688 RepID=A0A8J6NXB6_9GAMM|nr:hypothetical protein [Candidatus Thiopontia autotrophica]MBL6969515.1 hypothetical protein [Gammaproteobacteria bacterium]